MNHEGRTGRRGTVFPRVLSRQGAHQPRVKRPTRKAVLVASLRVPGFFIPLFTGMASTLRLTAKMLGAKPVASLRVGMSAMEPRHTLPAKTLEQARRIGMKLA